MLGRLVLASVAFAANAGIAASPQVATTTPAADTSNRQVNYSYAVPSALFGSTEVYSPSTWRFPQWTDMLARNAQEIADAQHICGSDSDTHCVPQEWQALVDEMRGRTLSDQIKIADDAMNAHPYVTTMQNWHRPMYWETAFEFLRDGGQCQDYAIAKYLLLRAAGVPANLMRMVVLHDAAIDLDHAVLAVYVDGEPMLLDNLRAGVVSASQASEYHPYYSINENGWWYHFGGQAMPQIAAAAGQGK